MIINKMIKLIFKSILISALMTVHSFALDDFQQWVKRFETRAIKSGISEKVVKEIMSEAKFLPKVIEYDRYQPEFYEDTFTYIKKRTSNRKVKEGIKLYKKEKSIIEIVEKDFNVEKELLLALMGISGGIGVILLISGYRLTEPSLIAPFEYFALPISFALGWIFFMEWPFDKLFPGILGIVLGGIIIAWREGRKNAE